MATLSSRPRQPTKPTDVQRLARRRVVEREISTLLGRLREEIARRKFSQEALARSLGWSPSTLSELLSQKRTVELYRVLLICRVVGVPLKDLLYPNDETATEQLQLLLETRPKPGEFLVKRGGPFDAAELASATRELLAEAEKRRMPLSAPERRYLDKLIAWCRNWIVIDKRTQRRRLRRRREEVK